MAMSDYSYVKSFELKDNFLPHQWIVIELKMEAGREPIKDMKNLTAAAEHVMDTFKELLMFYGYPNGYHFIWHENTNLYSRRASKLISNIASLFISSLQLRNHLLELCLETRVFLFPELQYTRDFLTLKQSVCHKENLKSVCMTNLLEDEEVVNAEAIVDNMAEKDINELLFKKYNTNYNKEPDIFKKGIIIIRKKIETIKNENNKCRMSSILSTFSRDFKDNTFWDNDISIDVKTMYRSHLKQSLSFRVESPILPHSWIVVRIDGKGFHKFVDAHLFLKPNDSRSLELFAVAAEEVFKAFPAIIFGYGQSDEFSFVLRRYDHQEKCGYNLLTKIVTYFTSQFVRNWSIFFQNSILYAPSFDARVVLYPNTSTLRDYLSWRQVDLHINNMYNTCFWNLVSIKDMTNAAAEKHLRGTFSKDKLQIMKNMNILYYSEKALYRKGTVLYRDSGIVQENCDIISDRFWKDKPWILGDEEFMVGKLKKLVF